MTPFRQVCCALASILVLAASPVLAQPATAPGAGGAGARSETSSSEGVPDVSSAASPPTMPWRGYLSLNVGYQGTTNTFTSSWKAPYYLETESLAAGYSQKPGVLIDAGAGVRVWGALALGVAVSRYHRSDFASLSATVPHPLLFNQPRAFSATSAGPSRTETAAHVQAMWLLAARPNIQVGVFGGPTVFSVEQVTISAVNFAEVYPYTVVTVANVATERQTRTKVGVNVGGDVTILVQRHVGVGVLARYSGTTVDFTGPGGATVPSKAGGFQVGGGLRFRF